MKFIHFSTAIVLAAALFYTPLAFADSFDARLREQADSDYRIAVKAYRKAKKDYGDLAQMPEDKKGVACKRINTALFSNNHNYSSEDIFRRMQLKKQIKKLKEHHLELGCLTAK